MASFPSIYHLKAAEQLSALSGIRAKSASYPKADIPRVCQGSQPEALLRQLTIFRHLGFGLDDLAPRLSVARPQFPQPALRQGERLLCRLLLSGTPGHPGGDGEGLQPLHDALKLV